MLNSMRTILGAHSSEETNTRFVCSMNFRQNWIKDKKKMRCVVFIFFSCFFTLQEGGHQITHYYEKHQG